MTTPCVVIPRVTGYATAGARAAWIDHDTRVAIDLFLPHDPARVGHIVVWDGEHNEAGIAFYWRTKAPRTDAQRSAADEAVSRYRALIASLHESEQQPVVVRQRLPHDWRLVAWQKGPLS